MVMWAAESLFSRNGTGHEVADEGNAYTCVTDLLERQSDAYNKASFFSSFLYFLGTYICLGCIIALYVENPGGNCMGRYNGRGP